jgi:hypothetical protein
MQYQQIDSSASYPYPDHNIDPAKKRDPNGTFCLAYAKAAYHDWNFGSAKSIFSANGGDYQKFRQYRMGKQPINQYKKQLGVDEQTDQTWLSVDWNIRPIGCPFIDRLISRLKDRPWGIVATPIDQMAKTELDSFYTQMKAKLALRAAMRQSGNPELANHPMVALNSGDPMDVEELEMRLTEGEQFNRSRDAEQAIELGFYENDFDGFCDTLWENAVTLGVAGYKEWLGDDNKAKFRAIDPDNVISSLSRNKKFTDIVHAGEIIDVSLVDLALLKNADGSPRFSEDDLKEFASSIVGKWGNPNQVSAANNRPYDKFKCKVLDLEFYSYDTLVYRDTVTEEGNPDFRKADYNRGRQSDKYTRKKVKCVYKIKWIIGTDKFYESELATDMKRYNDPKKLAQTTLSFKFIAYNFHDMKAQGFVERLIPYLDDYQLTMLKIQNFKNRAVPSGWWINLDALEASALNKGGKNMTSLELIQMFFETGVLVGRSKDAQGMPLFQHSQPVIPIENTAASELQMFYQDLQMTLEAIARLTGDNDATMGEANPKTLVPGYQMANTSTNQTIAPVYQAGKSLVQSLAEDVLLRMKQGVQKGGVSGYAPALNGNTLRFMQLSDDLPLRDHGIMLEEKTTDDEKQYLLQLMQQDIANGYLDSSDAVLIIETHNVKQAMQIWAYRVKKAKQQVQQDKMQQLQQQTQGNLQAQQQAAQAAQQQFQMEAQLELQKKQIDSQTELQKEQMRNNTEIAKAKLQQEYTHFMNERTNQSKQAIQQAQSDSKIITQHMANEAMIEKQQIANQKPTSTK